MKKFLIVQTAFIGDVILATALVEKLHTAFPDAYIDFMLRKGNEGLLEGHPLIRKLLVWNKKQGKYKQLFRLLYQVRAEKYNYVINLQRFFSTGVFTVFSNAKETIGFSKNPLSLLFSQRYTHSIGNNRLPVHEVERNMMLVSKLVSGDLPAFPRLYPGKSDFEKVKVQGKYYTISPTSVWFTKQYPPERWVAVIQLLDHGAPVFLLGGKSDIDACEWIKNQCSHPGVKVMAGKLSFLESAALMKNAAMNFVNDSAPLHLASAMDAPVTAVFCSTVPSFGFGPLSHQSFIVETSMQLDCRPCGLHGYRRCPEKHFKCADIPAHRVISGLTSRTDSE